MSSAATSPGSIARPDDPVQHVDTIKFIGWVAMVVGMFLAIPDIQIGASSL